MKIGFWNVERLGTGSSDEFKTLIADVVDDCFVDDGVRMFILCEITSGTDMTTSTFGVDYAVEKVGTRKKKYKKAQSAQLGYAIVIDANESGSVSGAPLPIMDYNKVFNMPTYVKKGNNFDTISKRSVLALNVKIGDVACYFYHVNSSHKASYLVTWVAEQLRQSHGDGKWALIGDLNCQPADVRGEFQLYEDARFTPGGYGPGYSGRFGYANGGHTHSVRGLGPATRTLDHAVHGAGCTVGVAVKASTRYSKVLGGKDHPDHLPLIVHVT